MTEAKMRTASWVIKELGTGKVIMETYDRKKVDALNTTRYQAVPIHEHLVGLNRKLLQAPKIPLVLLSSVTVIDSTTTAAQARQWQSELEVLYTKHFRNPEPTWTWNDVHDCDRDVLIELEEVIRASTKPPLDLELVSSFRTSEWRAPYWKQLFSPCAGTVDLSSATLKDIPQDEQVQWQHAKVIQSCDGDLSDADESCLFADWQKAQEFYSLQTA